MIGSPPKSAPKPIKATHEATIDSGPHGVHISVRPLPQQRRMFLIIAGAIAISGVLVTFLEISRGDTRVHILWFLLFAVVLTFQALGAIRIDLSPGSPQLKANWHWIKEKSYPLSSITKVVVEKADAKSVGEPNLYIILDNTKRVGLISTPMGL